MEEIWDTRTNEELCVEYQQTKNEALFEYFLSRNYRLIMSYIGPILRKYPQQREELEQAGITAIWDAMRKFDITKDVKFSTWVYYFFKKNVWKNRHEQLLIKVPINLMGDINSIKEKVPYAIVQSTSLDTVISSSDSHNESTLEDIIEDDAPTPMDEVLIKEKSDILLKLLSKLSPRENQCIQMYYGLNGYKTHTLQQIGDKYNVTRERIRQIIEKGLIKVKRYCLREGYNNETI